MYTDIVALQPVALPPVLLDRVAGVDFDADLESESVGILDIRSVYDVDGVDTAPGGIVALADPALTTAAERPARFLRLEKVVSMPDRDMRDFRDSAFGVTSAFGMREVLGYAPIEPDGSVRVKVPANVAFAITLLDANGRRIGPRHNNWLQVRAGEELRCNGCHDPRAACRTGAATSSTLFTRVPRLPACLSRTRTRHCSRTSAKRWHRCARASAARPTAQR